VVLPRMQKGYAALIGRAPADSVLAIHRGSRLAGAGPEAIPTARGIATSICRCNMAKSVRPSLRLKLRHVAHGSCWPLRGDREKASAGGDSPASISGHLRWAGNAARPSREVQREIGQPAALGFVADDRRQVAPSKSQGVSVGNVSKSLRIAKAPHIRPKLLAEIGSLICSGETFDGEGCSAGCG
jgi:hypothetical protein